MEDPVVDKSLRLLRLDKRHKMAMMTMRMSTKPEMKMVNKDVLHNVNKQLNIKKKIYTNLPRQFQWQSLVEESKW